MSRGSSLRDAYLTVARRRDIGALHHGFFAQLVEWELRCRGASSFSLVEYFLLGVRLGGANSLGPQCKSSRWEA